MPTEYITRENALAACCADCSEKMRNLCRDVDGRCKKYRAIEAVPAEDVRPTVHANWFLSEYECLPDWDGAKFTYICLNCGHKLSVGYRSKNFKRPEEIIDIYGECPVCHADMRKEATP